MRLRFIFAVLVICVGIASSLAGAPGAQQTTTREDHVAWVAEALKLSIVQVATQAVA